MGKMKKIFILLAVLSEMVSCVNGKRNDNGNTNNSADSNQTYVYRFKDKFLDLRHLKLADTFSIIDHKEIKRENFHCPQFIADANEGLANYKNFTFELKEDRDIDITDNTGKLIKTISDPDKNILADNISGNSIIFSISTGVICAIRLEGDNGYHINKYDENGNVLKTWKVIHTIYNKSGNVTESVPYLYYFAHSDKEMVFSSIYYGTQQETIILNIINGTQKKMSCSTGGIIIDPKTNYLAGLVHFNDDKKEMEVEIGDSKWQVPNEGFDDAAKSILYDSVLVIAKYNNIATGCSVDAYNTYTGKLLWKGDVKQLDVGHSKYYNVVHLTLFEGKLILEGNEAYGDYLQVLDLNTGKRLFESMPNKD
jgi:hypothetical protein